jgi:hypothetical protein
VNLLEIFPGLGLLQFTDTIHLNSQSMVGKLITTEESERCLCASVLTLSDLLLICERALSAITMKAFFAVCRCFSETITIGEANDLEDAVDLALRDSRIEHQVELKVEVI